MKGSRSEMLREPFGFSHFAYGPYVCPRFWLRVEYRADDDPGLSGFERSVGVVRQVPVYFYSSQSGMVRLFAQHLGRPVFDLGEREVRNSVPDGPWVLLTPSYKTGNANNDTVPEPVKRFLKNPAVRRKMVGIMGSGNRNFGSHYQAAARQIAKISGRPMLFEFELQGTQWDVEDAREILGKLDLEIDRAHLARAASAGTSDDVKTGESSKISVG